MILSNTVARPLNQQSGGKAGIDLKFGTAHIAYAGFEGRIDLAKATPGYKTFTLGTTLADEIALGGSVGFEIPYIVPTSLSPFIGVGFGGEAKFEAPTAATTLLEVNVDEYGNVEKGGVLQKFLGGNDGND